MSQRQVHFDTKACPDCQQVLPISRFYRYRRANGRYYHVHICRYCYAERTHRQRAARKANA